MEYRGRMIIELVAVFQLIWLVSLIDGACFPALYNFGDSTSDSGGIHSTFPRQTPAEFPPYGETYPGRPTAKYSDGRLLIDFLCEAIGLPFLSSAMSSVDSDYHHGANFATAGATVQPVTYLSPFPLPIQYLQFLKFKQDVIALRSDPKTKPSLLKRIPTIDSFSKGLYMIGMAGNDFTFGYTKGETIEEVKGYLPNVAGGLAQAVRVLYSAGARYLILHDVEPHGCLPYMLTLAHLAETKPEMDEYGCMPAYNEAAIWFNDQIKIHLNALRKELPELHLHFLSTYDIKLELARNVSAYGFESYTRACCGVPSAFNYNLQVNCGKSKVINNVTLTAVKCKDPNKYFVWDGVHNTDHGNRYVVEKLLTGKYFDIPFPELTETCTLNTLSK
ncbi:hypothetical protein R1flu_023591 [Riccia fluitans]|uniref:Uncharacterized protein n=1 Tax=Riccia fluitans TaxID=41844 RepID=A0ABD1XSH1_9MARC